MPALTSTVRPLKRKFFERYTADQCIEDAEVIAQLAITRGWRGLRQSLFGCHTMAPIHRFSREILTNIFLLYPLESSSGHWSQGKFVRPSPCKAPLVFTHVCKAWREIAISIPALWSSIDVHFSDKIPRSVASSLVDFAGIWLRRSGDLPLSLSITVRKHPDAALPVLALFFRCVPRWQHIRWWVESDEAVRDSPPFMVLQGPASRLETLEISTAGFISQNLSIPLNSIMNSAPRLRQCSFTHLVPHYELPRRIISLPVSQLTHLRLEDFQSVDDCLEILRDSRQLIECDLDLGRLFECSTSTFSRTPILLSELRSLQIRTRSGISNLMNYLTLSSLSDLTIHFESDVFRYQNDTLWPQSQFISLIRRSSCSLTRLHFKSVPLSEENLLQCLKHTTVSLKELHIEDERPLTCVSDTVLTRLSHRGSGRGQRPLLCPQLHTFRFSRCASFTMGVFANMVESRVSAAQIVNPLNPHFRCVCPKNIEVAMITWSDRLEILRVEGLQLKIAILPA